MKQGLSLRVSQHLALTPQLQQSIRLLQLSTLELSQEVEQMLDENPFLERNTEEAPREEFGLEAADTPAPREEEAFATNSIAATADIAGAAAETDADSASGDNGDGIVGFTGNCPGCGTGINGSDIVRRMPGKPTASARYG